MNGYKLSPICKILVEKAEAIGEPGIFTSERFLVAVIDAVAAPSGALMGPEWEKLVAWHNQSFTNPAAAKATMVEFMGKPNRKAFLLEVYAHNKMDEAAKLIPGGVVTALNLCWLFANDPTDTVRPLLTPAASKNEWKDTTVAIPDVVSGMDVDTLLATGDGANGGNTAATTGTSTPASGTATPADGATSLPDGTIIGGRRPYTVPRPKGEPRGDSPARKMGGGATTPTPTPETPEQPVAPTPAADTPQNVSGNKTQMSVLVEDTRRIRTNLKEKIFGQDHAINVFVTGYYQARVRAMTDKGRNRVLASFLFAGPPGVGKTFLAEEAAAELKLPFLRLDMSEYSGTDGVVQFCGLDNSYKDSHTGFVTSFVKEHPQCVILFDEVEKAHSDVIHLFLQMLDAGQVQDRHDKEEISFRNVICIFTTNAGRPIYEGTDALDFSNLSQKVILAALNQDINPRTGTSYFPAALCSRFASDNLVMFNHIQAHHLRGIARKEITRLARNLEMNVGIHFDIDESVYTALLLAEGASADARTVRGRAENFFNSETYELFRLIETKRAAGSLANVERVKMLVDLSGAEDTIASLFAPITKIKVLVVADAARVAQMQALLPDYELLGVQDAAVAVELLRNQPVDFALLDFRFSASEKDRVNLHLEDVQSPARSLFHFVRENKQELPVYILEQAASAMNEEERVSFLSQGARGSIFTDDSTAFVNECSAITAILCQQASMLTLAKANKVVSFETAQTVSEDGTSAVISLFDMDLETAVDATDSKSLANPSSIPNVHFADIIGAEDAKAELQYFVDYLRNPKRYLGTGVKAPRGVLLYGPPGTGKTMLAKAMACEAGCTFIAAQGNQFRQQYLGQGAAKVRELFQTARKYAPAILFIDEIDAIAKERTGGDEASTEAEATLTAFLAEMDGFSTDPSKPVFVLAATNFDVKPGSAKSLDGALLRRFDNRIYVDLPNKEERVRFLKLKISKNKAFQISDDLIENLASRGVGMSLAELDSVLELALRSAIRKQSTVVNDEVLEEAFENFNGGEKKQWDPALLERVARHESGHALLCWLAGEKPTYITVVARGNHGGYMQRAEQEGKALSTVDELLARIRISLGGRAAEMVYYGERDGISTGPSGDLASATYVAQHLVCTYGMDEEFGLAVVNPVNSIGEMVPEVRQAVNRILKEQMEETLRLVRLHKEVIDAMVTELLYKNHLNEKEIAAILSRVSVE